MLAIRHAVKNVSTDAITDAGILAILRGEGGAPAHLRAMFGNVSLRALEGAGAAAGISLVTILRAYEGRPGTTPQSPTQSLMSCWRSFGRKQAVNQTGFPHLTRLRRERGGKGYGIFDVPSNTFGRDVFSIMPLTPSRRCSSAQTSAGCTPTATHITSR